ncbi:hypothetical protein LXL04_008090 [Taraxacum kok-saghyz]
MILTLWDSFDTEEGQALEEMLENTPIIYAMHIKVTTFYGLSLTTKKGSTIMINPPVPDEVKLLDWKASNNQELLELLNRESYKNMDELLPYPDDTDMLPNAIAREMMKAVSLRGKPNWVKGNLSLPAQERSISFTGCANCLKPIKKTQTSKF